MAKVLLLPDNGGKSSPPSPEDWSRHREEIVDLYQKNPLDEVRKEMLEKYNFKASKRMYDQRFKQWKVSKNIKRTTKENMARQILASGGGKDASKLKITEAEFRKVMRHVQSQTRKVSRSPLPVLSIETPEERSPGMEVRKGSTTGSSMSPGSQRTSSERSSAAPTGMEVAMQTGTQFDQTKTPSVENIMSFSPNHRNAELLCHTVNYYFPLKLCEAPDWRYVPGDDPGSVCKIFWSKIENAIYLRKIAASHPSNLKRSATEQIEATHIAAQALVDEPVDFVRRLFYTLSPTNTAVYPLLRHSLLRHLRIWSTTIFGLSHPLTLICGCLQYDEDSAEVSRVILHQMYDVAYEKLGFAHILSSKLMQSIIAITRRAGDLEGARELGEMSLDLFRNQREDRAIKTRKARTAARELAVILTKLEEHGRAQELRLEVVENAVKDDDISVHTMEDIAEHEDVVLHNSRRSAEWLHKAAGIATMIWGDTGATRHITDKLDVMLSRMVEDSKGQAGPTFPAWLTPMASPPSSSRG